MNDARIDVCVCLCVVNVYIGKSWNWIRQHNRTWYIAVVSVSGLYHCSALQSSTPHRRRREANYII